MTDSKHQQTDGSATSPEPAHPAAYLAGVLPEQAQQLTAVNKTGLTALRSYLDAGEAVAFLGAGTSAPVYPLWGEVIAELIDTASDQGLPEDAAATCRALAVERPDSVVEVLRRHLGVPRYQAALRAVFQVRRDPESGRTWTPTQELVCRCPFKAVVTTNYDPGIVDARMRVRPHAVGTGFASWTDELALDRWRTGDVFGDDELPVLFAHGHHNQPEAMVLATTEYRRAYAGKLSQVLARMVDAWHLVWIGFSFADQRISSVLREVANHAGTRGDPGGSPRHVAVMAWDPDHGGTLQTLRTLAEIEYGADLILYPASGGDHSALQRLLGDFVVAQYPPAPVVPPPSRATRAAADLHNGMPGVMPGTTTAAATPPPAIPVQWVPTVERVDPFTGRLEELARLDRWAADPTVRLVGVTAWGGAGKTALVTHWLNQHGGTAARPGLRGVFGWSFYADPSADNWATALLEWANRELGVWLMGRGRRVVAVLELLTSVPVVLVLDGLEVLQEGPKGGQFGRLLDGTLREVLTGACRLSHAGLVVLTSRFAFADLESFDGGAARMLDLPPFTPAEGATLLGLSGGGWLPERERLDLVEDVDGHALAVAVLGSVLAERLPTDDLERFRAELAQSATTNARVARVLRFYADRLSEADRYLVAAVGLFAHPVTPDVVLTMADHAAFSGRLDGLTTPQQIEAATREQLAGLLSLHPDGSLSAHPLVRETFRPLALGAAEVAATATLTGVPEGKIQDREDGLRVVEAIELLLDADHWQAADNLWSSRTRNAWVWTNLPAVQLGLRGALAFVATPARRQSCADQLTPTRIAHYLSASGLFAMYSGDLVTAREYLGAALGYLRHNQDQSQLPSALSNLAGCLGYMGDLEGARQAAAEAIYHSESIGDSILGRAAIQGWVEMLAGDSRAAEEYFLAADRNMYASITKSHLRSTRGVWWGEFLARTRRPDPARRLTDRNREISTEEGWNENVAHCDRLLARLDLGAGDPTTAMSRAAVAVATFRDGDYLVELAESLPVLAESVRVVGDLDAAAQHVEEAISITSPRSILSAHAAALAVRARLYADQAAAGNREQIARGRDAADAAHRIATRRGLAWQELDALDAHAHLDEAEMVGRGWAQRAAALRARLVPAGLDPDPLATVERQVAEEQAEEQARGQHDGALPPRQ